VTWRLLVGGSRDGQAIDADPGADRSGVTVARPLGFDDFADCDLANGVYPPEISEMYLPRRWVMSGPHPCVRGLNVYRQWIVLVHASLAHWQPYPQTIAHYIARTPDVTPDVEVIEPTGDVGPFVVCWWDSATVWAGRLRALFAP
jgi:hypothetical protein